MYQKEFDPTFIVHFFPRSSEECPAEKFTLSLFLVALNRIFSFLLSLVILCFKKQPVHQTPVYKYSFCALTIIIASLCNYESLKLLDFTVSVVGRQCKLITVMIVGKLMIKKTYHLFEYFTAVLLITGLSIFTIFNQKSSSQIVENSTTIVGMVLLFTYLLLFAFTSNWQKKLFDTYHQSPYQMMCFVNIFSSLFIVTSLLQQQYSIVYVYNFMKCHPRFIFDSLGLAICSTIGQLFIFCVIESSGKLKQEQIKFGSMTVRKDDTNPLQLIF